MKVFFPYCVENGVKHIIHLGDYYDHRKNINFKALNANRKHFLDQLKKHGMTMDVIPGNHDVFYRNTNELCSLKELLGYYTNNVNIVMRPTVLDYDGLSIGLLPWINSDNYADSIKFIENCSASMIGGHLELNGFEMYKGVKSSHGMSSETFSRFDKVFSGHFHTKSTGGNIYYFGSQMEFNWSDYGDTKYFHVLDTKTREVTPVQNPLTLHEKVYYDDSKKDYSQVDISKYENKFVKIIVVEKNDYYMFDKFIDRLQQDINVHELKIMESFSEFSGEGVDGKIDSTKDTVEVLDEYIEMVDTELDKDKLKGIMKGLYNEAQNMEVM